LSANKLVDLPAVGADPMEAALKLDPAELDLDELADYVLAGAELSSEQAHAILDWPDDRLPDLLTATFKVRSAAFGRRVKICVLRNAQSGICPEDCHYCSQSRISHAEIPVYKMQSIDELVAGAHAAVANGARRYCMVCSMRGPDTRAIDQLATACERIRVEYPELELCLSLGLLEAEQARRLKAAGAGWINHNLNTSRRFYPQICTTHTYDDRVRTIENIRAAGLSVCSGGIIGMGESDDDIVDLAFATRRLQAESVPINFLHPIAGTSLEHADRLTPERCLKTACLFRLLNPRSEVRAAGGRELNLGERQSDIFNAVNSIFVNGYLTTSGWGYESTRALIEKSGFEVEDSIPSARPPD
jgi:biotin synthase